MIVNTQRLFPRLAAAVRADVVCDVGSLDGADALRFRRAVPHASIYAFEPNPENFRLLRADAALRRHGIEVADVAITNYDGTADFFIVAADYTRDDGHRGRSSLHERFDDTRRAGTVAVKTARLDTFLTGKVKPAQRVALWIDVEGKAYEVIEGAARFLESVHLLHIEVETRPCIGRDQKLYEDIHRLLTASGFVELATDRPVTRPQLNVLFARRHLSPVANVRVRLLLWMAAARQLLATAARRLLPANATRWLRERVRA